MSGKLGILVGGGPAPGINCVIGAATIRARLSDVDVVGILDGFEHLMEYALYASIFGGVLTLALLQYRAFPMPRILLGRTWAERLHQPKGAVPYGIALAAAAMVVYPSTSWMQGITG